MQIDDERWEKMIESIGQKGPCEVSRENFEIEDDLGNKIPGTRDIVIFNSEMGRIKMERENRPLILEKKVHYHKTSGGGAQKEYVTSSEDFVHRVSVYRWEDTRDDWLKIEAEGFI